MADEALDGFIPTTRTSNSDIPRLSHFASFKRLAFCCCLSTSATTEAGEEE
jgi:hypothetical protein